MKSVGNRDRSIPADRLDERVRRDTVQSGEVGVEHHSLATSEDYGPLDTIDQNAGASPRHAALS